MEKVNRDELFKNKEKEIEEALKKRRHKWKLNSIAYMDYNDVCQIITHHIYSKLHLYDPERPFINWCNKIISHRMQNLVRDNYGNLAPPCNSCQYNEGEDKCGITPSQLKCNQCPMYAKWEKAKKSGYNLKLAQSLDNPDFIEQKKNTKENKDLEKEKEKIEEDFKINLENYQYQIYKKIYLKGESEKEVSLELGVSINEVKKVKILLIKRAKKILNDGN